MTEENKKGSRDKKVQVKMSFYTTCLWTQRRFGGEEGKSEEKWHKNVFLCRRPLLNARPPRGRILIVVKREELSKWFFQFSLTLSSHLVYMLSSERMDERNQGKAQEALKFNIITKQQQEKHSANLKISFSQLSFILRVQRSTKFSFIAEHSCVCSVWVVTWTLKLRSPQ